jgi:hypothetical protein
MNYQVADGGKHGTAPMLFGLRVVMLGRQGSGKGTQGGAAGPAAHRAAHLGG